MAVSTLVDLVKVYTPTSGQGTLTLGAAVPGFLTPSSVTPAMTSGSVVSYGIADPSGNEVGQGTLTLTGSVWTLTRGVTQSSNGGAPILCTGQAVVALTLRAEDIIAVTTSTNIKAFGAVGDGVTDDYPAFAAALASGALDVFVPATPNGYRLSAGITLATNMVLHGSPTSIGDTKSGTVLLFDSTVPTCVTLNGGANNLSPSLRGLVVERKGLTSPAGSIGVLITSCLGAIIEDVSSFNHAKCWRWAANGVTGHSTIATRIFSGLATDVHVEIDSWPELRFSQCRFGSSFDANCNAYVRITGGESNPATHPTIGPNRICFENTEFNQEVNAAARWLTFDSMLGGGFTAVIFVFTDCHIGSCTAGIGSNSSTDLIDKFIMQGCVYSPSGEFWGLNAATTLSECEIVGCQISANMTLAPNANFNAVTIDGCRVTGAASFTGVGSSTMTLSDNWWGNGLTLAGVWTGLSVIGGGLTGGSLTCTATGTVSVLMPPTIFIMGIGTVAGNTRGAGALDWQASRAAGFQVASGAFSVLGGGEQNTVSGTHAVIAGGLGSAADGDYSWIPGGVFSFARTTYGRGAWASGQFATTGDAQAGEFVLRCQTTNATVTRLTADSAVPSAVTTVNLPVGSTYLVRMLAVAHQTGGSSGTANDSAGWVVDALLKQGANAAATSLVGGGGASIAPTYNDAAAAAWRFTVAADTTFGAIAISGTGEANKNINWVCRVLSAEAVG